MTPDPSASAGTAHPRSSQLLQLQGDALAAWLLGDTEQTTRRLRLRVQVVLTTVLVVANLIGALAVASLALFIVPGPSVFSGDAAWTTFIALPVYVVAAFAAGIVFGTRRALRILTWIRDERTPSEEEAQATLAIPFRLMRLQALLWAGATVLFSVLYGLAAGENVPRALFAILLGGVVVCANAYLLAEFALRPISARVLQTHTPRAKTGVRARTLVVWVCGSAMPVLGLGTVAVFALVRESITVTRLAVTVLALCAVTLICGLLLTDLLSRATIAPIRAVREAMAAVRDGNLDVAVLVYDSTELGDLQSGFNEMAEGLRDREQVRDLFGRHVGESVAAKALASEPELGGEERFVAVLFVDVVASTSLAFAEPPAEVVRLLNRFFTVVVEEVESCGGLINKFIGDAALAIFGAPTPLDDACGTALSAARSVVERLAREVPECSVGAGVAAGVAVAGNIGTRRRFEYTVIGDPVNEGARLADLAKDHGGLVASGAAVEAAGRQVARQWEHRLDTCLRGRDEQTAVYVPTDDRQPAHASSS